MTKTKLTYEERTRMYITECDCPKCGCKLYTDKKYIYCVDGIASYVPCNFCMTIPEWNEYVNKCNSRTFSVARLFGRL